MLVCEAAGYQMVLIETVGVGQSEAAVAGMTDCFLALLVPGAGDELQGIKRGLLEWVDVLAVNKADGATRPAAELTAQQYRTALTSLGGRGNDQAPAVLTCSALLGQGVDAVWTALKRRHAELAAVGSLADRRRRQSLQWLWLGVEDQLLQAVHTHPAVRALQAELEAEVLAGAIPATVAARRILEAFGLHRNGPPP
jgi:LAO/AO transport system kinase